MNDFTTSDISPPPLYLPNDGDSDLKNLLFCRVSPHQNTGRVSDPLWGLSGDEMLFVQETILHYTLASTHIMNPEAVEEYKSRLANVVACVNHKKVRDEVKNHKGLSALRNNTGDARDYLSNEQFCKNVLQAIPMFDLIFLDEFVQECPVNYNSDNAPLFGLLPLSWIKYNLGEYSERAFLDSFIVFEKWYNRYQVINLYHNMKYYKVEELVREKMPALMDYFDKAEKVLKILCVTYDYRDCDTPEIPYMLESKGLSLKDLVDVSGPVEEYTLYNIVEHLNRYYSLLMNKTLVINDVPVRNVTVDPLA